MNAITTRRLTPLSPAVPNLIPADFAARMQTDWSLGPHDPAVKTMAAEWLAQIGHLAEPVSAELIGAWTLPIAASVSNPRPAAEIPPWKAALMLALDGVPAGAFTATTQRELLRRCAHWPSAAEVYAVVSEPAARIRATVEGLRRVVAAPTKVADR